MRTWPQAQFQVCDHHQGDLNCMACQGTKSGISRGTLGKTSPIWLEIWVHGPASPPTFLSGLPPVLSDLRCQLGLEDHIVCDKVAKGWAYQVGGGTEAGFCCRWLIWCLLRGQDLWLEWTVGTVGPSCAKAEAWAGPRAGLPPSWDLLSLSAALLDQQRRKGE